MKYNLLKSFIATVCAAFGNFACFTRIINMKMKKIFSVLMLLFLCSCSTGEEHPVFKKKDHLSFHSYGVISYIQLIIYKDYKYSLTYDHTYNGTYEMEQVENQAAVMNLGEEPFPDEMCDVYRMKFSKIDVELPYPFLASFDGFYDNVFLYYFNDIHDSPYTQIYIEEKTSGAVVIDPNGNMMAERGFVFVL